ncbi:hypothetical protein KP79_PYT07488 [Mizuhopecten yessoensis]|uniref:Tripartite motif-containing protein 2 n=1 Tax=Mizuhopecten yessoensis TaxID=6573 RepID=A0A210PXX8_MIZYE|nr:hypothetical protein KP79_PYT07488 [Mizuhopecten yessoensis]
MASSMLPSSVHNQFFRNQMLEKPEVISEFLPNIVINAICPTYDGNAICGSKFGNKLMVYGPNGDMLRFIGSRVLETISGIAMSPLDHCLWLCVNEDCGVVKVDHEGDVAIQFHTDQNPWCLCVTRDHKIIVGFVDSIASYSLEGKKGKEVFKDKFGKKIVSQPQRITECPVSQNIAVLDKGWSLLSKDKPCIIVFDRNLHLKFRYNGTLVAPGTKASSSPSFQPRDVIYDMDGQLLVANKNKNSIDVVNEKGQHLRTLMTDEWKPVSLGLQLDNTLWAVFKNSSKCRIKLLRYTEPV